MTLTGQALGEHVLLVLAVVLFTTVAVVKKRSTRGAKKARAQAGCHCMWHRVLNGDGRQAQTHEFTHQKCCPEFSSHKTTKGKSYSRYVAIITTKNWRKTIGLDIVQRKISTSLKKYRTYIAKTVEIVKGVVFFTLNKQLVKFGKWLWHNNVMKLGWWRHLMGSKRTKTTKQYNRKLALFMKLPFRDFSRWAGRLHTADLPRWVRQLFIHLYVWVFKCKVHEALIDDLTQYKNLNEFFRRQLKPGIRPVDQNSSLTSPVDGTVLYQGQVKDGIVEQVKGVTYSLKGFLGPANWPSTSAEVSQPNSKVTDSNYQDQLVQKPGNCLFYSIIYLGPSDYHRFHSPADWTVSFQRHFPGELFSVNPSVARWLKGLFNYNERAVFYGSWQHGFFSMSAVGATNVGSIKVAFDEELETNKADEAHGAFYDKSYTDKPVPLTKGQHFGEFNIGSTIVLVFEAPSSFQFKVNIGEKLKYGQPFGN